MSIEIKFRKCLSENDTYFYDLYVNDIWICGYYSLEMIKQRISYIVRTGRYDLRGI